MANAAVQIFAATQILNPWRQLQQYLGVHLRFDELRWFDGWLVPDADLGRLC
jgi:hypothetical protein